MRLDELAVGAAPARILGLTGDPLLRERIAELGLTPGQEVRVLRRAPLGDPMEVSVRGFALALRRDEAAAVLVEAS
ncbi:MAG: FeoA family protein [Planctomycetota bacterium]|jgi:Fe2+ transport system protein FeoA